MKRSLMILFLCCVSIIVVANDGFLQRSYIDYGVDTIYGKNNIVYASCMVWLNGSLIHELEGDIVYVNDKGENDTVRFIGSGGMWLFNEYDTEKISFIFRDITHLDTIQKATITLYLSQSMEFDFFHASPFCGTVTFDCPIFLFYTTSTYYDCTYFFITALKPNLVTNIVKWFRYDKRGEVINCNTFHQYKQLIKQQRKWYKRLSKLNKW